MGVDINTTLILVAEIQFKDILTNSFFLEYLQSLEFIESVDEKTLTDIKNLDNTNLFKSLLKNKYLNEICLVIENYIQSLEFKDIDLELSHFNSINFSDNIYPNKSCTKDILENSDLTLRFTKNISYISSKVYEGAREEEYLNIDLIPNGKEHLQNLCDELDIDTKSDIYMCLSTEVN